MDHYHDSCHIDLIKIAADINLPKYAREKDLDETDLKKLSSYDFAFPEARYFPIHTKEDAILSSAFFLTKKAEFGKYQNSIYNRLRSACMSYNILDDFDNLEGFEKQASTVEYALPELQKFPINTKEEVTTARKWLRKQASLFTTDQYQEIESKIEKKAAQFYEENVGYEGPVRRILDIEKAAELMLHRAKKTTDPLLKVAMLKITKAMMVTQQDFSNEPETLNKLAEFIDRFDNLSGVNKRGSYLRGKDVISRSEIFRPLEKQASATVTLDGKTYTSQDLEKVSADQLRNALGDSFVNAISDNGTLVLSKFAEIADTLPLPDKKILAMYLS